MDTVTIDGINFDIDAIEKDCWHRLINGAVQYKHPMHNCVVANLNDTGINMRTVVLRKAWAIEKQLAFYTDIRSPKWNELIINDTINWLFYDDKARIQIKITGIAVLQQQNEFANLAWANTNGKSRKNYETLLSPSTESLHATSGMPAELEGAEETNEISEAGRQNFGVIISNVKIMEWLWLGTNGHRRAKFTYHEDGSFTASWLVP